MVHSKVVSSNRAAVLFIMKRVYRVFGNNLLLNSLFQIKTQKVLKDSIFVKWLDSKIVRLLIIDAVVTLRSKLVNCYGSLKNCITFKINIFGKKT